MIIRFTNVEEFVEELKKEYVSRGQNGSTGPGRDTWAKPPILRMTCEYRGSKVSVNIRMATVVVTIKSTSDPQDIIRLERYCGDMWGIETTDVKTDTNIEAAYKLIEEACTGLGIEVRAGVFEPETGDKK